MYSFYQRDDELFGAIFNDGSGHPALAERSHPSGSLEAFFVEDKFKPFSWLAVSAGLRPTHFSGAVTENALSPRLGLAWHVPRWKWTFRAFYGQYYQAPPLTTVSGPLIQFCSANNCVVFCPCTASATKNTSSA